MKERYLLNKIMGSEMALEPDLMIPHALVLRESEREV